MEFAAKTLGDLRAMKDRMPIARLITEAIDRTAYDAVLLAEFLGERKLANLYKLIEQARSFDQSGIFTLSDFITQLAEFVARQPDEPLAATQSETMDVVRLMTIHQAKGLEFPVVVVPDIARPQRGPGASAAFTPELGPMVKDDEATVGYDLFSLADREEAEAEIVRLLYVACTRAADYLVLSSGLDKPGEIKGPWMELLSRRFDLFTGRPVASRHAGSACESYVIQAAANVRTIRHNRPAYRLKKSWKRRKKRPKRARAACQSILRPFPPTGPPAANFPFRA